MATATYNTRFTTGGRLATVELWLRKNAKSKWKFKLEDVSDDMSKKTYVVMFNDKSDYDLFRHRFPPTKVANRNPEPGTETPETEESQNANTSTPPEPESDPPAVKPELGTYLKYTAGNFVSALAKAFVSKPTEQEEQQASTLPPSFRSNSAKSSSPSTLPPPPQKS